METRITCCWLVFAIHWELEPQGQPLLSLQRGMRSLLPSPFSLSLFFSRWLPLFILDTLSAFHSLPNTLSCLVCQLVSRTCVGYSIVMRFFTPEAKHIPQEKDSLASTGKRISSNLESSRQLTLNSHDATPQPLESTRR